VCKKVAKQHNQAIFQLLTTVLYFAIPPSCGQFRQHFKGAFCADILVPKNYKPKTQLFNFWCQKITNPKHSFLIFGAKILC